MASVPTDVRAPFQAWARERLEANATLLGLLARPNPAGGLGGIYQEMVPAPRAGVVTREALYPAVVVEIRDAAPHYAAGGNAPDIIGFELLARVQAVTFGRLESLLTDIANEVYESLYAINITPDGGLVSSMLFRRYTGRRDPGPSGQDYVFLGADWDVRGDS